MLSSDKTHLSNFQGDKESHPLYMSCGNINKWLRTKASARCWIKIAEIPIVKFAEKAFQGLLSKRLYHKCASIVLECLIQMSHQPELMSDPSGILRLVRAILAVFIGDLPEKSLVSGMAQNRSPISLASLKEFGDAFPHDIRTGDFTKAEINKVNETDVPLTLAQVARRSKLAGLNGVVEPFWAEWKYANPGTFLVPDSLHDWHKFFMDHIVQWIRMLVGDTELDKRFEVTQHRVGFRHFKNGFTRFKQHTGREQRDIERQIIASINGHPSITPGIMRALRALLDFIYTAQYDSHSDGTIDFLERALERFHENKEHLSRAGVRDGKLKKGLFNIPKLELIRQSIRFIKSVGCLSQFTGDQTERLHIANAKVPYRHTNRKDFATQICRYLDRDEKVRLFSLYISWMKSVLAAGDRGRDYDALRLEEGYDAVLDDGLDPGEARLRHSHFDFLTNVFLPFGIRDAFAEGCHPTNTTTAFVLKQKPDIQTIPIDLAMHRFRLAELRRTLNDHYHGLSRARAQWHRPLPFEAIKVWYSVRMQLRATQNEEVILPAVKVMASPPTDGSLYGHCNFVLVRDGADGLARTTGVCGEQIGYLIF